MKYRIGVDVGGTFTDLVYIDEEGKIKVVKASSTPQDSSIGIEHTLIKAGIDLKDVELFSHGTTLGANTIIQNKGAQTAIITTRGFRDIIELRRGQRVINNPMDMYNLQMDLPQDYVGGDDPLVKRPFRFEVSERIDYRGTVVTELDEHAIKQIAQQIRKKGIKAVAICYLFSFVNPTHEQKTKEILQELLPEVYISVSSDILPVIREYERLSTTVVNAYIMPAMQSYLLNLHTKLRNRGFKKDFYLMQSGGGIISSELASLRPVYTIDSGPAGGVAAAAQIGTTIGFTDLISFDMGGTTAKVCVIKDGKPGVTTEFWVGNKYFIGAPVLDMVEIGAGGGSIAWIDGAGAVHIGPQSAGAEPGPACYKRGGSEPTVTDADMVLGYINSEYFLGGQMEVDIEASKRAIKEKIADKLDMSVVEAAHGIYRLINANMLGAMRLVTVQRGYDPRDFSLFVSGGTAAIHAVRLAQELHIPRVIVPLIPGAFSAFGLITADAVYDVYRSYTSTTLQANPERIQEIYNEMRDESISKIKGLGFSRDAIILHCFSDMRYVGQAHEVRLEVPVEIAENTMDHASINKLTDIFHQRHAYLYGHSSQDAVVEFVTLSISAVGPMPEVPLFKITEGSPNADQAKKSTRMVYFEEFNCYVQCPTFERELLGAGNVLIGPSIVEQMDTTVVIPPGHTAKVDQYGNIIIDIAI